MISGGSTSTVGGADLRGLPRLVRLGPLPLITLHTDNFHGGEPKNTMTSLDDLEVRRMRPFERICMITYWTLAITFGALVFTFLQNILTKP